MLISIDIGNTHIVTGLLDEEGKILLTFRVSSNEKLTEDEYFSYFRNISRFNGIEIEKVSGIIVSSVVPNLITVFQFFGKKYFNIKPMIVDLNLNLPFDFASSVNPTGFGADRIANIVEAIKEYNKKNLVIFDFGTATTYEVLKDNTYIGGGILPGIQMNINALCSNTAKLPKVKFSNPKTILGYDTNTAIQAGIFYGYIGQIKHIIKKIKEEVGEDAFVVATGGLGKVLSEEIQEINVYNCDLNIKGLYSLYKLNS